MLKDTRLIKPIVPTTEEGREKKWTNCELIMEPYRPNDIPKLRGNPFLLPAYCRKSVLVKKVKLEGIGAQVC